MESALVLVVLYGVGTSPGRLAMVGAGWRLNLIQARGSRAEKLAPPRQRDAIVT